MKNINKKIILYVDDNLRDSRIELLEEAGYIVSPYLSHVEAEKDIKNGLKFDVAVIDRATTNSRTTGDDLMRLIKEKNEEENLKIPIISISAYNEKSKETELYLRQPFAARDLINYIEEIIKLK